MYRLKVAMLIGALLWPGMLSVDAHTAVSSEEQQTSGNAEMKLPLSLEQCIEIGLRNNPDIAGRKWDIEASLAEQDIASSRLLPSVSLLGGYSRHIDSQRLIPPSSVGGLPTYTRDIFSGDIVFAMPLYTGGRLVNEAAAREHIVESFQHLYVRNRHELIYQISAIFYSILGQHEVIESLVFSQKTLQEHLRRMQELLDAQKVARVDLLRTEVRLADIEQKLLSEKNVLHLQRSLLASVLGVRTATQTLHIEGSLKQSEWAIDVSEGFAATLANRQDYQSTKQRVEAQQKMLDAARAGKYPTVSLEAAYGNRWAAGSTQGNTSRSEDVGRMGVFVAFPLYDGGLTDSRVRLERARLSAERERLRKLELQIQLEIETASSNVSSAGARVAVSEKAVEQAKESLRIERKKYDLGKGTIVDVLDAQAALLESQTTYYRALAEFNAAVAEWRLAVGERL